MSAEVGPQGTGSEVAGEAKVAGGAKARMTAGVTGAAGFLGGETARLLASAGHRVVDLDAYCWEPTAAGLDAVSPALDWVLHFAARTSIAESLEDPGGFMRDNLASTRAALDIAVSRRAALLYMSSYVYGQPRRNPVDEEHPVAELNPYMASKLAGERLCREVCGAHGLPLVVLRPFSIFGRQRQPGRLISDLLDRLRQGRPLAVNDPTPRRDHLYAPDLCRLVQAIVEARPARAGTYNAGSGVDHANLEVAEIVRRLSGERRPVVSRHRPRPGDVSICVADLRKTTATFGWSPRWTLEEGLRELVEPILAERAETPPDR